MMIVGFSHKLGDSLAVGCASWDLSSKRRQEAPLHSYGLGWVLWWAGRAATSLAVISCILGARAALSATVLEGGGGWNQSLLRLIYSCSLVKKEYKLTALFISQIKRERERVMGRPYIEYHYDSEQVFCCVKCKVPLFKSEEIISRVILLPSLIN